MSGTGGDPVRATVLDLLRRVDETDAYANLLLPTLLRRRGFTGRDAAFATELGYGSLRRRGSLDAVLGAVSSRPLAGIEPAVLDLLRLGAYQLLHTRVPPHAAVASTVELTRARTGERAVGFVNAVLRRVAAHDWPTWLDRLTVDADPTTALALAHGYPAWVVEVYAELLDPAELPAALADDRPTVHLAARPARISRDELLAQAGPAASPGPWSPYAVHLGGGDPADLPAVADGRARVVDEGSQLAALVLARAEPATGDDRWLDLCAGPGGKAALLADLAAATGARLTAADRSATRTALLRATLAGSSAVVLRADGTRPPWPAASFDRVLVDAPCTGLGALRRRPELRWRRDAAAADRLHTLQVALLRSAVRSTRPGGVVAYVTCSPHPRETAAVVAAVRAEDPALAEVDARRFVPELTGSGPGPHLQLWPHRHGTDAMFVAVLRVDHR